MSKPKVNPVGRPAKIKWSAFALKWRNHSDPEIAKLAGCTVPNVRARRLKLMQNAKEMGKDPDFYKCSRAKWTQSRPVEDLKPVDCEVKN